MSRFVERFAAQFVARGMQPMPSRVFAALLASDSGVMTAAELSTQLQASPAAISLAVRFLTQQRMISREREPGSRRDRYRAHADQWYETLACRDGALRLWRESVREGIASLGEDTPAGRRLTEALTFIEFVIQELQLMLARWREYHDRLVSASRAGPHA